MVSKLTLPSDPWQQQMKLQLVDIEREPNQIQIHYPEVVLLYG